MASGNTPRAVETVSVGLSVAGFPVIGYSVFCGAVPMRIGVTRVRKGVSMRHTPASLWMVLAGLMGLSSNGAAWAGNHISEASVGPLGLELDRSTVDCYEMIVFHVEAPRTHAEPFDPQVVRLDFEIRRPDGRFIELPGFWGQDYEWMPRRREGRMRDWCYPRGSGGWHGRFAPDTPGTYQVTAVLIEPRGRYRSKTCSFTCRPSAHRGFVRVSPDDSRYLAFDDGGFFFPIGQNVAFIGESQYVTPAGVAEVFGKMASAGANFARVWTCCEDWAIAIEARKSAWDRSWARREVVVPDPADADTRCVQMAGADGTSLAIAPSHAVALRAETPYVLRGRFKCREAAGVRVQLHGAERLFHAASPQSEDWQPLEMSFTTGEDDWWLGRGALFLVGQGAAYIKELALTEADSGPNLLWEAEVNRPERGYYNPLDCFLLDRLVEAAEGHGVYLMLCLLTRDLYMPDLKDVQSPAYAQAVQDAQNLLRYAVARWGYSTAVAMWEYFNEMDPGRPTGRFYEELGLYLDRVDPYRHLRTTSTWGPSTRDLRHGELDVGQVHHYMRPGDGEGFRDEISVLLDRATFLRTHGTSKPVLIGEFGLADDRWGLSEYMKKDRQGVHFQRGLWVSAMSGVSGTALFWWWDQLDRYDLYGHYRGLSRFMAGVDLRHTQAITASANSSEIRIVGYQGPADATFYLADTSAGWWPVVAEGRAPSPRQGITVVLNDLPTGTYRVQWWDTRSGEMVRMDTVSASQPCVLSVPTFTADVACQVFRIKE